MSGAPGASKEQSDNEVHSSKTIIGSDILGWYKHLWLNFYCRY